jgi:NAD(P)-dependent dehydrogenase (short-subunit alcohol dehydrogenase family)
MRVDLAEQVALVTGGASGIGRASALALAENGCRVAVADRDLEGAGRVCAAIAGSGGEAILIAVDVADSAAVESSVEQVRSVAGDAWTCWSTAPESRC